MPSKEATGQGGVGCPGRGSLRPPVSALGVAASGDSREVGVSAEGAETAGWIGYADHRQRARFVLAIKGCGLGHVEAACGGVLGIIEPEADVKRVGRRQGDIGIEPEDLIQQNRPDAHFTASALVRLNVRLIPGHAEVLEIDVRCAVRPQRAALYRKQIEGQIRFEVAKPQNQGVIQLASHHRDGGFRISGLGSSQAVEELRIGSEVKRHIVVMSC